MFSLTHCIYYKCIVNGSNNLEEFDARPLYLCPVCLRKLQYNIGFDVCRRYRRLYDFYQRAGFEQDSKWVSDRLTWILGAEGAKSFIEQNKKPEAKKD
jgi:archaemetzincin